jgi:hypothetical protein
MYENVQIINADHDPPYPFVIVDRFGMHVDLSKIVGQLWSDDVAEITWGNRTMQAGASASCARKTAPCAGSVTAS